MSDKLFDILFILLIGFVIGVFIFLENGEI